MTLFRYRNNKLHIPSGLPEVIQCVCGKSGVTDAKQEGDHATPKGTWLVREVFYRPDRVIKPETVLPLTALNETDGWCDDPKSIAYNQRVRLPFSESHERLWRDDGLYDLIVPLGYNDDPPKPGLGSAIFLHVARPDWTGTEGCLAVEFEQLQRLIRLFNPGDAIEIS